LKEILKRFSKDAHILEKRNIIPQEWCYCLDDTLGYYVQATIHLVSECTALLEEKRRLEEQLEKAEKLLHKADTILDKFNTN
jgi:hypothetical protein